MYPYLFGKIPTYSVLLIIGLFGAVLLFRFLCGKLKVDDKTYNFYSLTAVVSIVAGILFAVLFQAIYNWIEGGFKAFSLESGMTFMGGLIGGVLCFVLATVFFAKGAVKKKFWYMANLAAPCIVLGHMFGRIGCFFAGCCYGKETTSFLGVRFVDYILKSSGRWVYFDNPRLPTQLLEAFFLAILFAAMMILLFKYKKSSMLLIVYLYAYAVFRFCIEFLRDDPRGGIEGFPLSPSQIQSIVMLLAAVGLTLYQYYFKRIPFAGKTPYAELTAVHTPVTSCAPPPAPDDETKSI